MASERGKTMAEWAEEGWEHRKVDPPVWVDVTIRPGDIRIAQLTAWLRHTVDGVSSEWEGWCGDLSWQPASRIQPRPAENQD